MTERDAWPQIPTAQQMYDIDVFWMTGGPQARRPPKTSERPKTLAERLYPNNKPTPMPNNR